MNDHPKFPSAASSEELDLFELCRAIWEQKYLLFGVVALCGLAALSYVSFVTREFQVSSVLRPVAINELDALNRSQLYTLPPIEALLKVRGELESYETRLGYFRKNEALFGNLQSPGRTLEQTFESFNKRFVSIALQDTGKLDNFNASVRLTFTYPEGLDGAAILNGFVKYAIDVGHEKIATDLKVIRDNRLLELSSKISASRANYDTEKEAKIALLHEADILRRAQLQDELKALRLQLQTRRHDRITQLDEALNIANTLGIKKPAMPPSLTGPEYVSAGNMIIGVQQLPLYFMGSEALEAERTVLQRRNSDDFTETRIAEIAKALKLLDANREVEVLSQRENEDLFLRDVEPLRSEISRLSNLSISLNNLKMVTIDQFAQPPLGPVKPQKLLIVLSGLMLGFILGLFLLCIRHFTVAKERSR
jgi:LPS O-antigen subunit length determinant protein (WzzB/FepE family)